jgi:hypothetical protein
VAEAAVWARLTDAEFAELLTFYRRRHPALAREVEDWTGKDIRGQLPAFLQILLEDMRRYQRGETPRTISFLNDDGSVMESAG